MDRKAVLDSIVYHHSYHRITDGIHNRVQRSKAHETFAEVVYQDQLQRNQQMRYL